MTGLRLFPLRWLMLTGTDAVAARGSFHGGYRHATSAQSLYFEPGSIGQALDLGRRIEAFEKQFPGPGEIRAIDRAWDDRDRLYSYEEVGDLWHFRNDSQFTQETPFVGTDWRIILDRAGDPITLALDGDEIIEALRLMPLLGGARHLNVVVEGLGGNPYAARLLSSLVMAGAIEEGPRVRLDIEELPEFLFLGHTSIAVRQGKDLIVIDPVGMPPTEILGGSERPYWPLLTAAQAIFITHHHWDHLHFQTLVRIPRDKLFVVPRCFTTSFANPSIAAYLQALGFSNIHEAMPWEEIAIGGIQVRLVPFRGEPFGLNSHFDAFTYHITFGDSCLYGSVDACHDENGTMDEIIERVAEWGPPDYFLFGASGQRHVSPCLAAGLRHFSNELKDRHDLIRYHPDISDVERWARVLKPRCLVPYAEFLFGGTQQPDISQCNLSEAATSTIQVARQHLSRENHLRWVDGLVGMATRLNTTLLMLQPMQGVT